MNEWKQVFLVMNELVNKWESEWMDEWVINESDVLFLKVYLGNSNPVSERMNEWMNESDK